MRGWSLHLSTLLEAVLEASIAGVASPLVAFLCAGGVAQVLQVNLLCQALQVQTFPCQVSIETDVNWMG